MPASDAPGPFSLSDQDRVNGVLDSAGFHRIDVKAHDDLIRTPAEGISDFADSALCMGAVQRILEGADPETVQRVRAAIEDAMQVRLREGEVALTRAVFLVRAE